MVIEAINIVLGAPFKQSWIKNGQESLDIEALFCLVGMPSKQWQELQNVTNIPLEDQQIIIRRKIHHTRRSSCFINGQLATLSMLQQIGNYLIDLHGQHEQQSLLNPEYHIDLVDSFEMAFLAKRNASEDL